MHDLENAILWRLADRPAAYVEIVCWAIRRSPRQWPGAVGKAICKLNRGGWIELSGGRWRIRREP